MQLNTNISNVHQASQTLFNNILKTIPSVLAGTITISLLLWLSKISQFNWIIAPFGATCVLLYTVPNSPFAQPRSVLLGHLLSAFVGLCFAHFIPLSTVTIGLAAGLSIGAMQLSKTIHPPAGATPLVILLSDHAPQISWFFLISPVLIGCLVLIACSRVFNMLNKRI